MAMPHRLDPPVQWAAAARCGKLVAQGILEPAEIIPQLCRAAVKAGYTGDKRGLLSRFTCHVNETADHWRRERDRTEWLIRRAVSPLIEARAPSAVILEAARAVNEERGEPFINSEVVRVVGELLAEAMARMARSSRQKGRRNAR